MTSTPTSLAPANPATAFYAGSRIARAPAATWRTTDGLRPRWGTRAGLRGFFAPLPLKIALRRPIPEGWEMTRWRFEGASLAAYRRRDAEPGRPKVLLIHGWAGHGLQMQAIGDT